MEETRRAVDRLASALRGSRGLRAQLEQVECPARSAAGKAGWEAKGSAAPLPFVCAAQLAEITAAVALCRSRRRFPSSGLAGRNGFSGQSGQPCARRPHVLDYRGYGGATAPSQPPGAGVGAETIWAARDAAQQASRKQVS